MITEKQCKKIVDIALAYGKGKADGVEVIVSADDIATSRFANNEMTQNQAPYVIDVSVRVLAGARQARASAADTSPAGIRALVDKAIAAAKFLEADPDLLPLYAPPVVDLPAGSLNGVATGGNPAGKQFPGRYDSKTARLGPAERARAVKVITDVARAHSLNASGVYSAGSSLHAIGNSAGLFRFYRETEAECSITMTGGDSSGWSKESQTSAALIEPRRLAELAAGKALASANPIEIPPGHYKAILEPAAVLDLLGFFLYDFTGTSYTDKLSCFLDKLGTKVFGDNITIVDDVSHPLQSGVPFDGEGLPRSRITLVENGVVKSLVHGRRSARKFNVAPTGHGEVEPSAQGEFPLNLVIAGGNTTVDEMIRATDKGILLTRVWYVREVDPTEKIVTGMTRDGTFLVEGGKVKAGTFNFRFNVSLIDMLKHVIALGQSQRTAGEEIEFPAVVPAMLVSDFNFSSSTKF